MVMSKKNKFMSGGAVNKDAESPELKPKLPPSSTPRKQITDSNDSTNLSSSTYECAVFCHDSQCDSLLNYNTFFLPVAAVDFLAWLRRKRLTRLSFSAFFAKILGQLPSKRRAQ